ncbi:MAG: T9SS type A sorting domain-containing protein [Bacteroidota bacterium]
MKMLRYGLVLMVATASVFGQQTITGFTAVTETFTGFTGSASPANWTVQGTGTGGTTWRGTTQTTGTSGGWYGNANMSFLGSGTASAANGTWLLQNNTGSTISSFTISFLAKMWKSGSASPTVTVSWSTAATSTNPAQGALANSLSSLTFNDATASISTGTTLTQTVSSVSIPNGNYIFIRFIHAGGSSSDNLGWDDVAFTAANPSPIVTVDTTSFNGAFGSIASGSASAEHTFKVSGTNLTDTIFITAPTGFQVSSTSGSGFGSTVKLVPSGGTVSQQTIYAHFSPASVTSFADNITVSSAGVTTYNIAVNGTGISPSAPTVAISASPALTESNLNTSIITVTLSNETFADNTLSTSNFTLNNAPAGTTVADVSYTNSTHADVMLGYDGTDFDVTVSNLSVTVAGAELTGASLLTSSTLSITASAENVTHSVTGPALKNFGATVFNTASAETSFTLSGSNLTGNITLTPPSNFEISKTTGGSFAAENPITLTQSSGSVGTTTIYVRYKPTTAHGSDSGSISIASHGTTTQTVSIKGAAVETEPTVASSITFGTKTGTTIVVNFSGGNGANRLLIVRSLSAPDFVPVDSVTYSGASADLPSAVNPGGNASNRLVYQGSGATVTVTGLVSGTTYYFQIFEFNGTGNTSNYMTTGGTGNATTNSLDPIALTTDGYTQNFNTLASTGTTGSVVPAGWTFNESGTNANATYGLDNGIATSGNTYSYGATSATERSLGSLASGSLLSTFGAGFVNNAGFVISQLPITYKGKQWRRGGSGASDTLLFELSTDASSLTTGTWTKYPALYLRSISTTASAVSLDGENAANQTTVTATITGLSIPVSGTFWIRWTDVNVTGSDDGLAIDDLSIDGANLPVELVSFTAAASARGVELAWRTATEVNNRGFEIERKSADEWYSIGFVEGNGNSNAPKEYSFSDRGVKSGRYTYRLKQMDRDGRFEYSGEVEAVVGLTAADYQLSQNYPNPFNPNTTITFAVKNAEHVNVTVYNALGQSVAVLFNDAANADQLYTLSFNGADLSSGTYFYSLRSASRNEVRKMLLTK